ncbi:MAG: pyridoxamine kinase [Eubacterium sp.]|nr:pyridoxamine kinase [Eubacterium sp.]
MKKIAVLNDISGFGRCSLSAALPIISAFGIQCCPLPTGVYSNQTGYDSFKSVDLTDCITPFASEWKKLGARFDAIIVGFVTSEEQGRELQKFIADFKQDALLVVDPIMADDGEMYKGFTKERVDAVCALAKSADVITPNLTELCVLCGREYSESLSTDDVREMSALTGVKTVVTTGIKSEREVITTVYNNGEFEVITAPKMGESFSGTGDIMVSYVTAELVRGTDVFTAAENATDFITRAIAETLKENEITPYRAEGIYFEKVLNSIK